MSEKEYIERGALLKAIGCENAVKYGNKSAEQQHKSYSSMMLYENADEINDAPAADVEPVVRGTWVEMRDPYGDLTGWIHEECGRETNAATEYCSKCGAKMTFVERSGSGE